jgi:hypothetical protein
VDRTPTTRRIAAVSTLAVATTVALSSTAVATGTPPTYTHKDSGRTVHLAVGTIFRVKLRTCTDCGDAWRWVHRPNQAVVKLLSKRVVSTVKPPAVGGVAQTIYRFKVVGAGLARERLVERGPAGAAVAHFRLIELTHN